MKLTDEQIQHIESLMKGAVFKDTKIADHILQLIADRQAWKEEAERAKGAVEDMYKNREKWRFAYEDVTTQLNQAVEVLEYYAFNHDHGLRAREYLSSLEGGKP